MFGNGPTNAWTLRFLAAFIQVSVKCKGYFLDCSRTLFLYVNSTGKGLIYGFTLPRAIMYRTRCMTCGGPYQRSFLPDAESGLEIRDQSHLFVQLLTLLNLSAALINRVTDMKCAKQPSTQYRIFCYTIPGRTFIKKNKAAVFFYHAYSFYRFLFR